MKTILLFLLMLVTSSIQAQPTWAVFGTSIEYGAGCSNYNTKPWPIQFKIKLGLLNKPIIIKNYGKIGATYCWSNNRIAMNKTQVQGASVIILGGPTNDAAFANMGWANITFKERYQGWIDSIKTWNPDAKIICMTAIKVGVTQYISQTNIDLRNEQVRFLANINNCIVWSTDQLDIIPYLSDGIHCNDAGYEMIANLAIKELIHEQITVKTVEVEEPFTEYFIPLFQGAKLKVTRNSKQLVKY